MTDALMPTLLACPFCGGAAGMANVTDGIVPEWQAFCDNPDCGATVTSPQAWSCRATWNRRAPQPGKAEGEGWVACSERMPLAPGEFGSGCCQAFDRLYGIQTVSYHQGAFDGVMGWDWYMGPHEEARARSDITHWRALSAPPPVEPARGGDGP